MARRNRNIKGRQRQGVGQIFTFPPPSGGLNLREDIRVLPPDQARELVNWLPEIGKVIPRLGRTVKASSAGSGAVGTLAVYQGASAQTPVALADGKIWNVSSSTATEIYDGSHGSNFWITENYNGFLFGVNGVDTPWRYDGSVRSATGFTGVSSLSDLSTVTLINNRLWFSKINSAIVEYAATGAVTGALTEFGLDEIARGGSCQAIANWSREGGEGVDDYHVFIMNTGEVLVYSGDPASTFELVGRYQTFEPIGRKCWFNIGGDLILITRGGLIPITDLVRGLTPDNSAKPIWSYVTPGIVEDAVNYGSLSGWTGTMYDGLVIVNVPVLSATNAKQYVLNTRKPAWTTFDLPANDFVVDGDDLLFSALDGGEVFRYSGNSDEDAEIQLISKQGFINTPNGANRRVTAIKPSFTADGNVSGIVDVDVDFEDRSFLGQNKTFVPADDTGMDWGDDWGGDWAGGIKKVAKWHSAQGQGNAMSLISRIQTKAADVKWNQTQVMHKPAGNR